MRERGGVAIREATSIAFLSTPGTDRLYSRRHEQDGIGRSVSGIYGVAGRATILDFGHALDAEQCVGGVVVVALRAQHRGLSRQFVEHRLRVLQVGGVEALGEPAVDFGELRPRLSEFIYSGSLRFPQFADQFQLLCIRIHSSSNTTWPRSRWQTFAVPISADRIGSASSRIL
jgi:hypothetical protein